jgi:Big-like domain-containing protein/carboxypeptidase family protein
VSAARRLSRDVASRTRWLGLPALAALSAVTANASLPNLSSFDIPLLGLTATPEPLAPVVPKNTESGVRIVVTGGDRALTTAEVVSYLGGAFEVHGDLSGPGLDGAITLPQLGPSDPPPEDPLLLLLPPLPVAGDYLLSNLRIIKDGKSLVPISPSQITVKVIDQVLITSVKTRPLTLDEIREKGIVLDSDSYIGFEFQLGLATDSQSVTFTQTVVFDRDGVPVPDAISPPNAPPRAGVTVPGNAPEPLIIPALLEVDPEKLDIPDIDRVLRAPSGEPIRIPSVLVIPGNVGYLKQFFSAQLFVANGAPVGSGLNVRDVTGKVRMPPGADQVVGTADDPLALPDTIRGPQATTLPVRAVGPDGLPATADDVGTLRPSEQGQTEFLIRGEKEGFHTLDFDINATLEGLPIGPVPVKGSARGGVLVRNPFFNMTFTIPSTVRKNETFSIHATVTNISQSIANDVRVTLDASRLNGAKLIGEPTQSIPTLRPRDARTLEFKFKSERTGQVVATYLNLDTGVGGGNLKFALGVDERGVALSPDTLVLPTSVGALPPAFVEAVMRVLGQAWSISNAPTGTLPPDVLRVSRAVATQKTLALAEAGLRVSLGQNARDAIRDLAFDFWGGTPLDPGFDQLLRQTHAGHDLARAAGVELASAMQTAGGPLPFERVVADVAISGPDFIGVAVGGSAPVTVKVRDGQGNETAVPNGGPDLARADIPGAVWLPLGAGASPPLLGVITALGSPSYALEIGATAAGTLDLAVTQPTGDGSFTRGTVTGRAIAAGAQARLLIDRRTPQTMTLQIDQDGDGTFDSADSLATERLTSSGPKLLSATVVGPETVDGASPFGFQIAALFDRVVDRTSSSQPSHYTIPSNTVQTARAQLSARFVFGSLEQPEGPYIPTTLTASGVLDGRGAAGPAKTVPLVSRLEDPGAVVSGRVIGADGTPVTDGVVTYLNNPYWWCPEALDAGSARAGFAAAPLDAQGRYEFRYVRQDRCGFPWSILVRDPKTSALRQATGFVRTAGEQIVLDIALTGQGSVTGVVLDLGLHPVPGAQVAVVSQTDPQVGGLTTTDGDGRYTISGITVGQVSVQAVKGNGVGQGSGSIPRAGATAIVNVTLDGGAGSVAGRVILEEGALSTPVPGVQVVLDVANTPIAVVTTDSDGNYLFSNVPAGAFKVKATMNSRDRGEAAGVIAAGDALIGVDVVISVPSQDGTPTPGRAYGTVRGTVRLPDGSGLPGAIVSIEDRGVLTGDGGHFEIAGVPVLPGTPRTVLGRSRDGLRSGAATVMVNVANQLVEDVSVLLSGLGSAEVLVVGPTGAPVAGQDVGLLDRCESDCGCSPKRTGADGKVRFDGLPLGTVSVKAVRSAVGFVDVATGSTAITRDGELATATIRFVGAGVVSGTVRTPNNQLAFGADVDLVALAFDPITCGLNTMLAQRVRTTSQGTFRFQSVNVGPVTVTASQTFFPTPTSRQGALTDAGQELVLDLALNDGVSTISGELSGTVFLPDGVTPAGAGVEVTANGPLPDVVVTTDAQGHYGFAKIFPEGNYTLTARDPVTGGLARTSVFLRAKQDASVDVRLLGRGTVIVRVVDAADVPVSSAFVRLRESSFPNRLFEGAVDAAHQGAVTFENVFEGPLSAEASDTNARGGRASSVLAGPGAILEMKVRLSMTGRVSGIFVAADGATPIPFGAVSLTAAGRIIGQTITQGAGPDVGRFSFDFVPAGPVRVDAQDPVTARTGFAVGTIESQGQVVDLKVRAQGLGTIEGFVTSNGAHQAGAEVSLAVGGFRASTSSDATGFYRVTGVPEGLVVATASLDGTFLTGTAAANLVGDSTTLALDVALRGSGKVTGRVLKSDGVTASRPASVSISVGGTGGGAFSTVTKADGSFSFDRVPAGLATLAVDVLGSIDRATATAEVTPAQTTEITIHLHGVGMLHGLARDSDGFPTRGTVVVTGTGDIPYTLTAAVGDSGTFSFPEVLAGPFAASLTVQTPTFTLYGTASGTVLPDQDTGFVISVQPSGVVKGRVLRSNAVTPAPGTEVTLELLPSRGSLILYTRDDGRFEIRGVPLGPLRVRARDPFTAGVALVEGKTLASNGQTLDVGDVVLDDTPVAAVAFAPPDGAAQVPITAPVTVTFTDRLASPAGVIVSDGGATLGGNATLSADGLTVTLTGTWPDSKELTITATTAVTDVFGRRLAQPASSRFRTVDLSPPKVVAVAPADGAIEVAADAIVHVTFNEPIDPNANVSALVGLASGSGSAMGTAVLTSPTTVAFTPAAPLANDSVYTITVNGARDLVNNVQTQAFHSSFKTHDTQPPLLALVQPAPGSWTKDATPEIVVSITDGLSGVDPNASLLSIDDVSVVPIRSTAEIRYTPPLPLQDGVHRIDAAGADRAGNGAALVA